MNEDRFIELLNLYVDQQLSAAESAELEVAIKQSPARRRTYQQYCRMQKACTQLFEHERSAAPASGALARELAAAERKVVNFPSLTTSRSYWRGGYSIAAVAAAACVAFVVVRQNNDHQQTQAGSDVAAVASPSAPTTVVAAQSIPVAAYETAMSAQVNPSFTPVFSVQALRDQSTQRVPFVSLQLEQSTALELDWMRQVKLEPVRKVSADEFVFNQRAATDGVLQAGLQTINVSEEQAAEQAAFQFQK
jgi:anti-sigma factor RsiW